MQKDLIENYITRDVSAAAATCKRAEGEKMLRGQFVLLEKNMDNFRDAHEHEKIKSVNWVDEDREMEQKAKLRGGPKS